MAVDLGAVALAVSPDLANFGRDVESGVEEHTSAFRESGKKIATAIGAGMAAAGAAAEGFARSSQDANLALERMGRRTGSGSKAMRDMASSMQNATFPMDEVVGLMELATKRGLEGDAIREYGNFWDMVGDATGESSQELAKAGIALGQVGIAAGDEAEALDAFGFITDNTTGSVAEFLKFTERTGKELGDNTPHVNDMAAALALLEGEGMSAQVAQRELQQALREADGDMDAALETLGLSGSAYDDMRAQVEGSGAAIEANAADLMDAMTPMQKMQAQVEKVMFQYGGLAEAAGMVAAPLSGVGMAMIGVAQVGPQVVSGVGSAGKAIGGFAKTAVTTTATVVKQVAVQIGRWALLGAQSLIHAARVAAAWLMSIWPIAAVIAAVVGLVVLIVKNWETIKRVIAAGWEWVKRVTVRLWDSIFGFLRTLWGFTLPGLIFNNLEKIKGFISTALNFIKRVWSTAWTAVKDFVVARFNDVVGLVKGLPGRAKTALSSTWNAYKAYWSSVFTAVKNFVADRFTDVVNLVKGLPQRAKDALLATWNILKSYWDSIFNAVRDFVRDRATDMVTLVTDLPGRLKAGLQSTWQTFYGHWKRIATAIKTFVKDRIDDVVGFFKKLPKRILDALGNLGKKLADKFKFKLPGISFSGAGDGPGAPPGGGGTALRKVQSALGRHSGASISSTYRDPVHNRRVGGSPTSYHLDRLNPAVDIVAPSAGILDRVYADLVRIGGWRELLWRVPNHAPGDNMHIHAAHTGGRVTEHGIEPLRRDELLSKLQVGETVLPRDWEGSRASVQFTGDINVREGIEVDVLMRRAVFAVNAGSL